MQHLKQIKHVSSCQNQISAGHVSSLIGSSLKHKERGSAKGQSELIHLKPIIKTNKPPLNGLQTVQVGKTPTQAASAKFLPYKTATSVFAGDDKENSTSVAIASSVPFSQSKGQNTNSKGEAGQYAKSTSRQAENSKGAGVKFSESLFQGSQTVTLGEKNINADTFVGTDDGGAKKQNPSLVGSKAMKSTKSQASISTLPAATPATTLHT